ncbi:(2Fe-2S)-binding protein [Variovorax sp. HJSM1_2]|uniref:(2Fe-2S)-binding protein n=1 Tax=Variovorax sp. HJSM1_2 TaxID=3366263 RepID=UPI003BCC9EC3
MIVCVCRRVSDREIARHARAGMGFDDIQFELGVATQCGQCEDCARDVIAQCNSVAPVAALHNDADASTHGHHCHSSTQASAAPVLLQGAISTSRVWASSPQFVAV